MKALTDERWQEIRDRVDSERTFAFNRSMLIDVLQQHDHLAAQIKLLADYIMSERHDDPAWKLGEGACAMAVEIMKREKEYIAALEPIARLGISSLREVWDKMELDYENLQTEATRLGVVKQIEYNSEVHGEHEYAEDGDPWFEFINPDVVDELSKDANP